MILKYTMKLLCEFLSDSKANQVLKFSKFPFTIKILKKYEKIMPFRAKSTRNARNSMFNGTLDLDGLKARPSDRFNKQ